MTHTVASRSNAPKIRAVLDSFASLRPAKKKIKPANANGMLIKIASLTNSES